MTTTDQNHNAIPATQGKELQIGDTADIINTTMGGNLVIEGRAVLVRPVQGMPNYWYVRFGDEKTAYKRFVDRPAPSRAEGPVMSATKITKSFLGDGPSAKEQREAMEARVTTPEERQALLLKHATADMSAPQAAAKINVRLPESTTYSGPLVRHLLRAIIRTEKGLRWLYWYWTPEPRADGFADCGWSGISEIHPEFSATCERLIQP